MATSAANNETTVPILIAVMGATGTGKSTLIHTLTGDENIHIGHGQESQTDRVQVSTYFDSDSNCNVSLVDTPGFDDSRDGVTDTDILQKITEFLKTKDGQKLNGLIYVHRISDPRMGGISKRNLRMFKALCGDGALKNVCIATTNWDRVTKEEGNKRERELRESLNLFKPLIDEGAQLVRHDKAIASARSIINYLIHKDPTKLQIQVEMDEGKTLEQTEAGSVLREEIKALIGKLEARLLGLKKEMEEAVREKHAELLAELEEERQKGEAQRKKLESDLETLKTQAQSDNAKHEAKIRNLEDKIAANEKQKQRDKDNQAGLLASNKRMVRAKQEPTNQAEPVERKSLPEKLARERSDSLKQVKRHDATENKKLEPRTRGSEAPRAEQKPKNQEPTNQAEPGLASRFVSAIWGLFSW